MYGIKSVFGGHKSSSSKSVQLKIWTSGETLDYPCQIQTTVGEVKEYLAVMTKKDAGDIIFFQKVGSYLTKQRDHEEIATKTFIKGIRAFGVETMLWPHPLGIIGTGYHGLKTAMTFAMGKNTNFVLFDRNSMVGGYCWITGANKTSRLQTELGSFHVWWGPGNIVSGKMAYPNCNDSTDCGGSGEGWRIWPYKTEIQNHFNHAADCYGIKPHIKFQTNVHKLTVVGDKDAEGRFYELGVEGLAGQGDIEIKTSGVFTYPGSLCQNRIIEYPGEDVFGGDIRYGMNDDTPYDKLKDTKVAILGCGAFAIENARTTIECGGNKAYIICRRKNLASPRMPSWFVHQGPIPTPGGFVLKIFEPMYNLVGFGDPWEFHAVHANASRSNVTILQNSRFGIGDVTFLMIAWGLLEYHETIVKRFSKHTLHLVNGEQLDGVTVVLKALGLLGDWAIDKLHGMKEMVGMFCAGDFRRPLMIDATGMNAANFTTFSTGIGTTDFSISMKYLFDFPKQWYRAEGQGIIRQLPKHKEEPDIEKPAYVTEVKFAMASGMILGGMMPECELGKIGFSRYKHQMYHASHGTARTLEVAQYEWYKWQEDWKERGIEHEVVEYPYTWDMIDGWFQEYSETMRWPIKITGPEMNEWGRDCPIQPYEEESEAQAIEATKATQNKPQDFVGQRDT